MFNWIWGEKRIRNGLEQHAVDTGETYELVKAGMPPLRLWIRNGKGDKWGKVLDPDGNEQWVRYRTRLFSSKSPLTFFD